MNDLGEITLIPETDDRATISFGLERFKRLRSNLDSINYRIPINKPFLVGEGASFMRFESIEHAQDVYNKIAEARQKRISELKQSGKSDESKKLTALGNFWAYVKIALITIPAVLVFGVVFIPQIFGPRQQTKEVQKRMGKVTYQSITSVTVSLVSSENRKTVQLDPVDYGKVAEYLRSMRPTENLGLREPWSYYRRVDVYAGEIGHFRLTLMTRKSLVYKALANVNIVDGASEDNLIVFLDANDFWNWLKERPVVAQQLDERQPGPATQSEQNRVTASRAATSFKEEELLRRFLKPELDTMSMSASQLHSEGIKAFNDWGNGGHP